MGNTYKFRVFSENKCGISEDAMVAKEEAKILKTGTFRSVHHILTSLRDSNGELILELWEHCMQLTTLQAKVHFRQIPKSGACPEGGGRG